MLFELFEPDRPKSTTLDNAEPLKPLLDKCVADLCGRSGWEATVDGKVIDPNKTYQQNHLTGRVVVHGGPREGGVGQ